MFKRIIYSLILVLLVCNIGWAGFLGIKKSSENATFFLDPPLDSLYGIPRAPDSVHIFTYADGDLKYSVRNATYPFTAVGIDTIKHLGDTLYQFFDNIWDIDGAGGNFLLNIAVALFYDEIPTYTYASVQVIADSLNLYLVDINDTVNAILDTLQLYDADGHLSVNTFSITGDAVTAAAIATNAIGASEIAADAIGVSEATNALMGAIADSTWDEVLTGATHNIASSAGRRLRQVDAAFTLATGTAQVSATPTDPGKYIILAAATNEADNFFNHASLTIDGGTGIGQSRAIEDYTGATDSVTLIPGTDWVTDPDATSTYIITPGHPVEIAHFHGDEGLDQIWEYAVSNIGVADGIGDSLMSLGDTLIVTKAEVINIDGWNPASDSVNVDVSAAAAASGLISQQTSVNWSSVTTTVTVEDSSGNTTTRAQLNLIEATDDHYNGMGILFLTGDESKVMRRITDYDGTSKWATWTPALTAAPATGVVAYIWPWATVSASASLSAADIVAITDTILGRDTSDITTGFAEMMKDTTVYQGAASGLTKEAVADAVNDTLEAGTRNPSFVTLTVAATGNNTAVTFTGAGVGEGLKLIGGDGEGNGLEIRNDAAGGATANAGMGVKIIGTGTGVDDYGLNVSGSGAGGSAVKIDGLTGSAGLWIDAAASGGSGGKAVIIQSTDNDALQITQAGTEASKHAIEILGGQGTNNDAVAIRGRGTGGIGMSIFSVDSSAVLLRAATTPGDGAGLQIDGAGTGSDVLLGGDSRIEGFIDSVVAVGGVATGTRTMTFVTLDTTQTPPDDTLSNILLEIVDKSGNTYYQDAIPSGTIPILCNDNDTFLVYVHALPQYNFLGEGGAGTEIGYDSIFIVNGDTTIDVSGYPISVGTPSSADLCRLYAFPRDRSGNKVSGAKLVIQLKGDNVEDTCTTPNTPIVAYEASGTVSNANDSGFTYIDVIKSKCLLKRGGTASAVKYKVGIDFGTFTDWEIKLLTVPDSTSHAVTRYGN